MARRWQRPEQVGIGGGGRSRRQGALLQVADGAGEYLRVGAAFLFRNGAQEILDGRVVVAAARFR